MGPKHGMMAVKRRFLTDCSAIFAIKTLRKTKTKPANPCMRLPVDVVLLENDLPMLDKTYLYKADTLC